MPPLVVKSGAWPVGKGLSIKSEQPTSTTITAVGDYSAHNVYIGREFTKRYRFSHQHVREADSSGTQVAVTEGRLQIKNMTLIYNKSGNFQVEVTPKFRDVRTFNFNARILGSGNNILGKAAIESGEFKFPVLSRNDRVTIDIVNDSYLPSSILSAEWVGTYSPKAKRL